MFLGSHGLQKLIFIGQYGGALNMAHRQTDLFCLL
jgi:hypothetical protein